MRWLHYHKTLEVLYEIMLEIIIFFKNKTGGSWLRHCATSRKVAVSIPDGVIGNFH